MFLLGILCSVLSLLQGGDATLVFAGDAMQHDRQIEAARRSDGSFDYSAYFRHVADYVCAADYAVVNLECTLGGKPYKGYPCFSAPEEYAVALKDAGFDLFLHANNHCLDRRDAGLRRTLDQLDMLGVPHVGTYRNAAERAKNYPFVADVKGIKIAFLNYTYGTNGITVQGDVVVDYIDRAKSIRISRLRAEKVPIWWWRACIGAWNINLCRTKSRNCLPTGLSTKGWTWLSEDTLT